MSASYSEIVQASSAKEAEAKAKYKMGQIIQFKVTGHSIIHLQSKPLPLMQVELQLTPVEKKDV